MFYISPYYYTNIGTSEGLTPSAKNTYFSALENYNFTKAKGAKVFFLLDHGFSLGKKSILLFIGSSYYNFD